MKDINLGHTSFLRVLKKYHKRISILSTINNGEFYNETAIMAHLKPSILQGKSGKYAKLAATQRLEVI